jgi:hypothetical protein
VPRALSSSVLFSVLAIGDAASAQTQPAFDVQSVPIAGRAVAAEIADFDGDGRAELLAIVIRGALPDERRALELRAIGDADAVAAEPSWTAPLPPGVAGYDVADVDGEPGVELLLLDREGVHVLARAGAGASWRRLRVAAPPTIAAGTDERGVDRIRLARPELGAGRLLVPGLGDAWLLGAQGESIARLAVGGRANYLVPPRPGPEITESEMELYFDLPTLQTADVDGDGRADVAASSRHGLRIFLQRPDGSFASEPDRDLAFRLIGLEDQVRNSGSVRSELADLDRDGRADLLVSHAGGGLLRAKNRTRIHRNRDGQFALDRPDLELERTGGVAADELIDLDGDGRLEWLRIFMPFGPLAIAELFLQRSVDLDVALHRPSAENLFEREPALTRSFSMPIDFETVRPRGFAPSLNEDWNRDGHRDLLDSAGGRGAEVWLGGPEHAFARATSMDAFDSNGRISIGDVDGDGLPDFVVHDPRREHAPLQVGVNRGALPGTRPQLDASPTPARP